MKMNTYRKHLQKKKKDGCHQPGRKGHAMKRGICCILTLVLLLYLGFACADPDLTLQDTSMYPGPWAEAYARILEDHSAGIQAYRDYVKEVTYLPDCKPIGLTDLTGDSTPELLFLDLLDDTEYGFKVGRLWIYTRDQAGVHCMLSLQPEIDDLLYSTVYLGQSGILTMYFNDTEKGWAIQFQPGKNGVYTAKTIMISEEDFSGEGPDTYYLNGKKIAAKKYRSELKRIQNSQGTLIGSLQVDDQGSGFSLTPEEAMQELASVDTAEGPENGSGSGTKAGQLPELSFSPAVFEPGQKFAVYSAPSSRSWRGANGKASITSRSEIFAAGSADGWILIQYELASGLNRVGYISTEKIKGDYTAGSALSLAHIETALTAGAKITDDPVHQETSIGKLKKGAKVICLASYQGWIYVEAQVSGKTARGFIPSSCVELD